MKKLLGQFVKYILVFGISGFLIWWSLHGLTATDRADIKASILRANYYFLVPVIMLLLLSNWFRSLRWRQIIEPLGYKPPVFDLLCGLLLGYLTNQVIPRAGEIVRCTVISREEKIPLEKLIGTVIIERSLDVVCLFLLALGVFLMEYEYINTYIIDILHAIKSNLQHGVQSRTFVFVLITLVIAFFCIYLLARKNVKWTNFFSRIFGGVWEGLVSIRKVNNKFLFIVYTILIWACYSIAVWIGCFAMHETTHLKLSTAVALLVSGSFGIILTPGGLGAYPYAIQKTLYFYGIHKNIAIAFGWMLWLIQFLFTITFGLLAYIALNERNKKNEKRRINSK
jgi:uncharacterized protein (TIRG00374 family)